MLVSAASGQEPALFLAISCITATLALLSLVLSYFAYRSGRQTATLQQALALHAELFKNEDSYRLLYRPARERKYFFNSQTRGTHGSFLGSDAELLVDTFLEKLNLVCMWLVEVSPRREAELFANHIRVLYQSPFLQQYFSFLDEDGPETRRIKEYYPFIHKYARKKLGLPRPNVQFARTADELTESAPAN